MRHVVGCKRGHDVTSSQTKEYTELYGGPSIRGFRTPQIEETERKGGI
jgi:hypothetical protein